MPCSALLFVAGADAHPEAERCRLQMRHGVGYDGQSVGEVCDGFRHAAPSRRLPATPSTYLSTAPRSFSSTG